ncbi:MAG: hypothetical protein ABIC82_04345 [bacterium]
MNKKLSTIGILTLIATSAGLLLWQSSRQSIIKSLPIVEKAEKKMEEFMNKTTTFIKDKSDDTDNGEILINPNATPAFFEIRERIGDKEDFITTVLTSEHLKTARLFFDHNQGIPKETPIICSIGLDFTEEGARLLREITERNIDKQIAFYIDNLSVETLRVNEKITSNKILLSETFTFTEDEAKTLVERLNAGRGLTENPTPEQKTP